MVKILKDEETTEKQEEKGFYIKHTDLAILLLPTMVENKGVVKVGRAGMEEEIADVFEKIMTCYGEISLHVMKEKK